MKDKNMPLRGSAEATLYRSLLKEAEFDRKLSSTDLGRSDLLSLMVILLALPTSSHIFGRDGR